MAQIAPLTAATDRLRQRVQVSAVRLQERLDAVADAHDLSSTDLRHTRREIQRMEREDTVPTPSEYWETTAHPWAKVLVETCNAAVDDEFEGVEDAVERFHQSVRIINRTTERRVEASEVRQIIEAELEILNSCAPNGEPLAGLAESWSRQLRRAAALRAMPVILFKAAKDADGIIGRIQVEVVDKAPWAHTDRLLSAFELGHADIRTHVIDSVAAMATLSPVARTKDSSRTLAHS